MFECYIVLISIKAIPAQGIVVKDKKIVCMIKPTKKVKVKSQNHRIVGVGRDLCGSSSPPPLPKQGHLQ